MTRRSRVLILGCGYAHERTRVAGGVFQQIADHLHEIDAIQFDLECRIDLDVESNLNSGSLQCSHERVCDFSDRCFRELTATTTTLHSRPAEFARDMSLHSVTNAFERLGDVELPLFSQQPHIGGQRGERGFETVREIGRAVARALDFLLAFVEQAVDLIDERPNFRRAARVEPAAVSPCDVGYVDAEPG